MTRKRIEGYKEAFDALYKNMTNAKGITFKLVVAVPYAEGANISGPMIRRFRGKDYITFNKKPGYLLQIASVFEGEMVGAEEGLTRKIRKTRLEAQKKKTYSTADIYKMAGIKF